MHTAVVEFDALADPVRAAAEDHRLPTRRGVGLALGRLAERSGLVGRVHVGGGGRELGRAAVDSLEDRPNVQRAADAANLRLGLAGQGAQPGVGEAERLQSPERRRLGGTGE